LDTKKTLRSAARARRATLTDPAFAQRIAAFAADLEIARDAVVAGYHPFRDEADPRELMAALAALGHQLALPCVVAARSALVFRAWHAGDPLQPNAYGIAEPLALLAFDASGHRLGYGGGYYDRTFEVLPRMRLIGVAYSGQEISAVPREAHDHRLDAIVTENGVRRLHHT
jgi:5-formyltetrahydrofolate cyclo-ligase